MSNTIPTVRTARYRVLGLAAGLTTLVACQAAPPVDGPGQVNRVTVTIQPGFRTQALTSDINHYVINLFGTSFASVKRHVTTGNASTTVTFSNVPPGMYKAHVEAFASSDDSQNISDGKSTESTNTVTVSANGSAAVFSPGGSSLTVNLKLLDAGGMASNDPGNPSQTHLFQQTKNSVTSDFVWIPPFRAYQLINPANCGTLVRFGSADNLRSPGYWVSAHPLAGQADVDFTDVTFGGFYVGKYEASHADATNALAGSVPDLSVRQNVVPWGSIDWTTAAMTCRLYQPNCKLIGPAEWTSLAVWSQVHGVTVSGNNNGSQHDADDAAVSFTDDPTQVGNTTALTGSGTRTGWTGSVNGTTHTGDINGVYDLNGNLAEWIGSLSAGVGNFGFNDVPLPASLPGATNRLTSLLTSPGGGLLGLPNGTNGVGVSDFGFDGFVASAGMGSRAVRGGGYGDSTAAGVWYLSMANLPVASLPGIGFRPVLRY